MKRWIVVLMVLATFELGNVSNAAEFMKLGAAIKSVIKTDKAQMKSATVDGEKIDIFMPKNGAAKVYAIKQGGIYPPNCTHTWIVGVGAKDCKIKGIEVVEMSCPHAFPTRKVTFLDQFKGKGPAQLKSIDSGVSTIAKATGSCDLTTKAVEKAIKACEKVRGKS